MVSHQPSAWKGYKEREKKLSVNEEQQRKSIKSGIHMLETINILKQTFFVTQAKRNRPSKQPMNILIEYTDSMTRITKYVDILLI